MAAKIKKMNTSKLNDIIEEKSIKKLGEVGEDSLQYTYVEVSDHEFQEILDQVEVSSSDLEDRFECPICLIHI